MTTPASEPETVDPDALDNVADVEFDDDEDDDDEFDDEDEDE